MYVTSIVNICNSIIMVILTVFQSLLIIICLRAECMYARSLSERAHQSPNWCLRSPAALPWVYNNVNALHHAVQCIEVHNRCTLRCNALSYSAELMHTRNHQMHSSVVTVSPWEGAFVCVWSDSRGSQAQEDPPGVQGLSPVGLGVR